MSSSQNAVNIAILQTQTSLLNNTLSSLSDSVSGLTNIVSQNSSSVLTLCSQYDQLKLQQTTDMQAISSLQTVVDNNCLLQSSPVNVNGQTSGVIQYIYINSGLYKKYVFAFQSYVNNTTTNQNISLPLAFNNTPILNTNINLTFTVTVNDLQIVSPNSLVPYDGILILEGI